MDYFQGLTAFAIIRNPPDMNDKDCRRAGPPNVLEDAVECVATVACGKDEAAPVRREQILGDEAVVDKASQVAVHGQVASY